MAFLKKTDKKLSEKNRLLREQKEIFRDAFDQSAMGEAVIDLNRTYLDVNERFCQITGYSKEELLGMNMADITHPDDIKRTVDVLRDLLLEQIPFAKIEKRYIRKDGKIVWGFLNITLVYGNGEKEPQYFFGQIQDISEFKESDQQLQDLQKKYRTIVEKGNDGIVIVQDFLIKFSNPKMIELTGYDLKDFQGKPFLSFISPKYVDLIKKNYEKRMKGEKVQTNYKVELVKKNGQNLSVEISGSIVDYEGKPADMAFIRDITESEKFAEQEKKRIIQIEKINRLYIGRELKMLELKKEIAALKKEIIVLKKQRQTSN